jgi:endonuclease-3
MMHGDSSSARSVRWRQIIAVLQKTYPDAHCELHFQSPLELLIATILSARCTDRQVNVVTASLFAKYRAARDYAEARPADLEKDLQSLGLFRNKARNIQNCCRALVQDHQGEVPRSMADLVALAGVGRKTANVVLGNAFGINAGLVVDTHVARLAQRLGLTRKSAPEDIEKDLQSQVDPALWTLFSHWLIWHGRRRCYARRPDCGGCELRAHCPSADRRS